MTHADPRLAAFEDAAHKAIEHLKGEFSKLQTGRANAALVDHIEVDAYGQRQQLRAVAGVTVPENRTIAIQPWDRGIMPAIEKALTMANLGTNPVNDGTVIRLNFPSMTTETRAKMGKVIHGQAEDARITLRKLRQEAHGIINAEKDEDVKHTLLEDLQKLVDEANEKIAELAKNKEEEVMKI